MTFILTPQLVAEIEKASGRDPQKEAEAVFNKIRSAHITVEQKIEDHDVDVEVPLNLTVEELFIFSVYFLSGLVQDEMLAAFKPSIKELASLFHTMYYYNISQDLKETEKKWSDTASQTTKQEDTTKAGNQ